MQKIPFFIDFNRIYETVQRRRNLMVLLLFVLTLSAGMGLFFVPFDDTLDLMLPDDSDVQRASKLLREADLAGKVVIWLTVDSSVVDESTFTAAATDFALELKPPLIERVITASAGDNIMEEVQFFFNQMPRFIDTHQLTDIDTQLTPQVISNQLRRLYLQLLKPQGSFLATAMRSDPLGIGNRILQQMQALSSSFGYDVTIKDGHFLSSDGQHIMMILETPVTLTDNAGSIKMLRYLADKIEKLPSGISAEIICGHQHTVSNQRIVKKDIRRTATLAAIAFLILFFSVFRDIRAALVFLIPGAAVLMAINLTGWLMGPLALLIVGLGAFIAGIAVDYGIHVYVAVRSDGNDVSVVRKIARPVCLGALTTVSVFFAFLFSGVAGYRQLGCISIISILLSLIYALFLLPLLIKQKRVVLHGGGGSFARLRSCPSSLRRFFLTLFALLLTGAIVLSFQIRFDSDVAHLDGTASEIMETEKAFFELWGGGVAEQGLFVVTEKNYQRALELNDSVYLAMKDRFDDDLFVSFARIWPAPLRQQQQADQWNTFWQGGREERLQQLLSEEGKLYGFSSDAFSPFFEQLIPFSGTIDEPENNTLFSTLKDRFVQHAPEGWRMMSFFPDTEQYAQALSRLAKEKDEFFVISRRALYRNFSLAMSAEMTRISLIAVLLIVTVTGIFLKNIRMAAIALLPAISGVAGMLSLMVCLNHPLNVANLIAGIVVIGLCIDYGIFVTFACKREHRAGTGTAITLSAATTLAGAGVLLFAQHPALFSVGLTLSAGVLFGYLSAMLVVPLFFPNGNVKPLKHIKKVMLNLLLVCFVSGCRSIPFKPAERVPMAGYDAHDIRAQFSERLPQKFQLVNTLVFHYYWKTFSGLGYLAVDRSEDLFQLSAMTPMGVKLFDLQGKGKEISCLYAMEEFKKHGDFSSVVGKDIRQIYFDLVPSPDTSVRRSKYEIYFNDVQDNQRIRYTFSGTERLLTEKACFDDDELLWKIGYYDYQLHDDQWYPHGIYLKNNRHHYSFEIRLKEFL